MEQQQTEKVVVNNKKEKKTIGKVFKLIRELLVKLLITVGLIFLVMLLSKTITGQTHKSNNTLIKLRADRRAVLNDITELKSKLALTKLYMDVWNNDMPEDKKVSNGIDMQNIRDSVQTIIDKHYIKNFNMNISVPRAIDSDQKKNSTMYMSTLNISFDAITDFAIVYFLQELIEKTDGFMIIEKMTITKTKDINKEFIRKIINGELETSLNANIVIQIFASKAKEEVENK